MTSEPDHMDLRVCIVPRLTQLREFLFLTLDVSDTKNGSYEFESLSRPLLNSEQRTGDNTNF